MIKAVSQALTKRKNGEQGFTLIELLVVVIIIGILAAIAIPVFLNMRQGAWKSSVESDVNNAVLAVEQAAQQANGSVGALTVSGPATNTDGTASPATITANSTEVGTVTASNNNTITVTITGDDGSATYEITGTNSDYGSTGTGKTYTYTSAGGTGSWK